MILDTIYKLLHRRVVRTAHKEVTLHTARKIWLIPLMSLLFPVKVTFKRKHLCNVFSDELSVKPKQIFDNAAADGD